MNLFWKNLNSFEEEVENSCNLKKMVKTRAVKFINHKVIRAGISFPYHQAIVTKR